MSKIACLLVAGGALLGAATTASAQFDDEPSWGSRYRYNVPPPYGYDPSAPTRPLPRGEIMDRLERAGYEDFRRFRFDGSVYLLEAISPAGNPVRLVVDAFAGRILREAVLGERRFGRLEEDEFFDQPGFGRGAGRQVPARPEEMPDAPRFRERPADSGARREAILPRTNEFEARAPVAPSGPPEGAGAPLAPPADLRLAPPGPASPSTDAVPREPAPRPKSAAPPSTSPGSLYGINPGSGGATRSAPKPSPRTAAKPSGNDAVEQPTAPTRTSPSSAPALAPATPKQQTGTAAADTAPRKPVRVIPGVTPMGGSEQNTPAPQNQVQAIPPALR